MEEYEIENKSYTIIKKVDNGYKVKNENGKKFYILEYDCQGYYYKDYESFENGEDVCYIPEYNRVNTEKNCIIVPEKVITDDKYYRSDIIKEVENELNLPMYNVFFKSEIPQNLINQIAIDVFDIIDWQHPSSYIYETDWEDFIIDYFERNPKEIEKYASEKLKKELGGDRFEIE